jgi:hypothetical protein
MKHTKFAHGIYYFGEALRVEVQILESEIALTASIAHRGGTVELLRQTHPWDAEASMQALVTAVAIDSSSMIAKAHSDLLLHYTPPKPPVAFSESIAVPAAAIDAKPTSAPAWRVS